MVQERIPVIIDTDPGVDDTLAILLALASPELEIKAITLNFGNTDIENAHNNILKIWHVLHHHFKECPEDRARFPVFASGSNGDIPFLARGSTDPLEGEQIFAAYFHGRDGLADITTRHPELSVPKGWQPELLRLTNQSAVDISLGLIRSHSPRSMTYIALGPLTNLACMMRKDAACVSDRLGRVVIMGGALEAPGNTTPVAEYNFYADPFAARELLHPQQPLHGFPLERLLLLPLDITTRHKLPFSDYKKFVDPAFANTLSPSEQEGKSPLTHFTTSILERTAEVMRSFGLDAMQLHDPMAVWCAICNPPLLDETPEGPGLCHGWVARKRTFQIERSGELTRGMLIVDRRRDDGDFILGGNLARVQSARSREQDLPTVPMVSEEQLEKNMPTSMGCGGISVVVDSPGPQDLVQLMFQRIWGACLEDL